MARWWLTNLFLAAASVSQCVFAAEAPRRLPNIIVLLADDLGYADLSLTGNQEVATPRIDSLAKNGVRCTNAYVSCPVCSPTRAGLLTGRYQQRFGHEFNPALLKNGGAGQGLPVDEQTIADRLRRAGYATGLVGKWHQGEEQQFHPLNRGFDEFFGFPLGWHSYTATDDPEIGPLYRGRQRVAHEGYLTDTLASEACDFIDRHRDQSFFLYLAFNAVHTPMEAPAGSESRFASIADPNRRTYLAMLASLDQAVGAVLDKLRSAGLEENTLIFFLSDNGGATTKFSPNGSRNTPLRGSKGDTWEGGIRVPFFVQWKGRLPAGRVVDTPVIQLDVAITALAAAGGKVDATQKELQKEPLRVLRGEPKLDGENLLPLLDGTGKLDDRALYWRFGEQMAVRSGDWKLVRANLGPGEYDNPSRQPMLFNLKDEVGEQHDLAALHPDKVKALEAAWDAWNSELMSPRWPATLKGKAFGSTDH